MRNVSIAILCVVCCMAGYALSGEAGGTKVADSTTPQVVSITAARRGTDIILFRAFNNGKVDFSVLDDGLTVLLPDGSNQRYNTWYPTKIR